MGNRPIWKRISPTDVAIALLASFAVIYLTVQTIQALTSNVTTVPAAYVTVDDAITAEGWFVRDETVAEGTSSSTVKHIVSNGEKVQDSAALAVVYADQSIMEASRRLEEIKSELDLLNTAVQSVETYTNDTTKTEQQIMRQMVQLSIQAEDGVPAGAFETAVELRKLMLRRNAANLDVGALRSQIVALESEKSNLEGKAYGRSNMISAPDSGYFSEVVDGYESVFIPEKILTMQPSDFRQLTEQPVLPPSGKLGKVVSGFTWYFATVLNQADVARLSVGQSVILKFSQISSNATATIQAINQDEQGEEALVVFSSNIISGELVSIREQKVDIVLATYEGLQVPLSAVTLQDGIAGDGLEQQTGVYILTGNTRRFKRIEKIYAAPEYYIVKKGTTRNELVIGDAIITSGLNHVKVVN